MSKLKYLITGTGRSGTVFMARLLTSLGLPCGHESFFDWRGIRYAIKKFNGEIPPDLSHASTVKKVGDVWMAEEKWMDDPRSMVCESSYMAVPFLGEECLSGVPVIHVVRDPVKVAHSFCNHIDYFRSETATNSYEQFIYRHLPELTKPMSMFDRTALYIVRWNQMIEKHNPALFHRIEDGPEKVKEFLGLSGEGFSDSSVNTFKKWSSERFEIHKIDSKEIRQEFVDMGRRYGYKMTSIMLI